MKVPAAWLVATCSLVAACALDGPPAHAHRVIVEDNYYDAPSPPPPEQVEVVPAAPSETVVWRPGHWKWEGGGWVWEAGHYVERPHPEAIWVPGHWIYHRWGSAWVPGHWA